MEKHYLLIHNSKMPDHIDRVGTKGRVWDSHTIISVGEATKDIAVNWRNPWLADGEGGVTKEFKGQGLKTKLNTMMRSPVHVIELSRSDILECLPVEEQI